MAPNTTTTAPSNSRWAPARPDYSIALTIPEFGERVGKDIKNIHTLVKQTGIRGTIGIIIPAFENLAKVQDFLSSRSRPLSNVEPFSNFKRIKDLPAKAMFPIHPPSEHSNNPPPNGAASRRTHTEPPAPQPPSEAPVIHASSTNGHPKSVFPPTVVHVTSKPIVANELVVAPPEAQPLAPAPKRPDNYTPIMIGSFTKGADDRALPVFIRSSERTRRAAQSSIAGVIVGIDCKSDVEAMTEETLSQVSSFQRVLSIFDPHHYWTKKDDSILFRMPPGNKRFIYLSLPLAQQIVRAGGLAEYAKDTKFLEVLKPPVRDLTAVSKLSPKTDDEDTKLSDSRQSVAKLGADAAPPSIESNGPSMSSEHENYTPVSMAKFAAHHFKNADLRAAFIRQIIDRHKPAERSVIVGVMIPHNDLLENILGSKIGRIKPFPVFAMQSQRRLKEMNNEDSAALVSMKNREKVVYLSLATAKKLLQEGKLGPLAEDQAFVQHITAADLHNQSVTGAKPKRARPAKKVSASRARSMGKTPKSARVSRTAAPQKAKRGNRKAGTTRRKTSFPAFEDMQDQLVAAFQRALRPGKGMLIKKWKITVTPNVDTIARAEKTAVSVRETTKSQCGRLQALRETYNLLTQGKRVVFVDLQSRQKILFSVPQPR